LFFLPFHSKALPNAFYKGGGGGIVSLINSNKNYIHSINIYIVLIRIREIILSKKKKKKLTHFKKNIHMRTPNKNVKEEGTVTQKATILVPMLLLTPWGSIAHARPQRVDNCPGSMALSVI